MIPFRDVSLCILRFMISLVISDHNFLSEMNEKKKRIAHGEETFANTRQKRKNFTPESDENVLQISDMWNWQHKVTCCVRDMTHSRHDPNCGWRASTIERMNERALKKRPTTSRSEQMMTMMMMKIALAWNQLILSLPFTHDCHCRHCCSSRPDDQTNRRWHSHQS